MTKDGERQRESAEQNRVDEAKEIGYLSKSTDNSHGYKEDALSISSSNFELPSDHALTHSKPENLTVRAHKECDVNGLSELSDCSNIQSDMDFVSASEGDHSSSIDSGTATKKMENDDSADKIVHKPPETTTENALTPISNTENVDTCPPSRQDESDNNNHACTLPSVESNLNADNIVTWEPAATEVQDASTSDSESVEMSPPSGQEESDDVLPTVEDSYPTDETDLSVGETSETETDTALKCSMKNEGVCLPTGQDEAGDVLSSADDAVNITARQSPEAEMKDVPISKSDVENVKVDSLSGQNVRDGASSSVEESACENVEEPPGRQTEDAPTSKSDVENVMAVSVPDEVNTIELQELEMKKTPISSSDMKKETSLPSGQNERTDTTPSVEEAADTIVGEPSEVEMKHATILNNSSMEVDEPPTVQCKASDELPSTEGDVSNLGADDEPCSDVQHEIDDAKLPTEKKLADSTLSSKDHCESTSKTSVDDGKSCALSDSLNHDDVKDEGDVNPVAGPSSIAEELNEPAVNTKTSTASTSENGQVVTTGTITNPSAASSLKGMAAKYSCVGSALKVAVPSKCIQNANSGTVPSTGPQKRVEKFSIKNISKVSKIFKVSNLSYKIKPVLKSAASLDCPIIYVGEPAFVDIEDFTDATSEQAQNDGLTSFKTQASDIDLTGSIPTAYATSMVQLSQGANQDVYTNHSASLISPNNPLGKVPYHQMSSPYSFPPYITTHPASSEKLPEKKAPIVNAVSQRNQKQNTTFQHGTAFRIVARPALKPVTADTQKSVTNKIDLAAVKPKPIAKPMTVTKNSGSGGVVSIAMIKPASQPAIIPSLKTKPAVSSQDNAKNKTLLATTSMKVTVPMKSLAPLTAKVNIYPVSTTSKRKVLSIKSAGSKSAVSMLPIKPMSAVSKPVISTLPVSSVVSKTAVSENATAVYKNTSTVYIKTLSAPKTALAVNPPIKVTAKVDLSAKCTTYSNTSIAQKKGLRAGVEVAFEDGVRHFITNLNQVTHLDDEPVNSWSELKRGTKVAAAWTDGQVYDATVIACYIPTSKRMQPVVALEALPLKDSKVKMEPPKPKQKSIPKSVPAKSRKNVGCTKCRKVFTSIVYFREHQRLKCNSTGVIVPSSASKVTDEMISAIVEEKHSAKSDSKSPSHQSNLRAAKQINTKDTSTSPVSQSYSKSAKHSNPKDTSASPSTQSYSKSDKRSDLKGSHTSKSPQSHPRSVKRPNCKDTEEPLPKKAKISRPVSDDGNEAIFKKGTKFLHRWQLDGGESRWYQGEVQSIVSNMGSFLNWEFEVSYKGEDDNYVLKLYEDFPTDIRIIGKM